MQERIQMDLKFDLSQKESSILDQINAENEDLHRKIVRERIMTEELHTWGNLHLDICFVRNLQERDVKCQRNFIVTVDLLKTSVFPEIISIHKADMDCHGKSRRCKRFCAREDDLKHIELKLAYDFVYQDQLVKEGFNFES